MNSPKLNEFDFTKTPATSMPHDIKPMLATLVKDPFDHPDWIFEIKWDGYRAITEINKHNVDLYSRKGISFNERYQPIVKALHKLNHDAIIDGEIVVVDSMGKSHFQLLQNYQQSGQGTLLYYVFDLIYLDGHPLRNLPLI